MMSRITKTIPYLRQWRLYRRMTHEELASAADLGRQTIIRLEKPGASANELTVYKLASALKIGTEKLLNEAPPNERAAQEEPAKVLPRQTNQRYVLSV